MNDPIEAIKQLIASDDNANRELGIMTAINYLSVDELAELCAVHFYKFEKWNRRASVHIYSFGNYRLSTVIRHDGVFNIKYYKNNISYIDGPAWLNAGLLIYHLHDKLVEYFKELITLYLNKL